MAAVEMFVAPATELLAELLFLSIEFGTFIPTFTEGLLAFESPVEET